MKSRIFVLFPRIDVKILCVRMLEQTKQTSGHNVITEQSQAGYETSMQTSIFLVINFDVELQSIGIVF
jgi:hypothetical protein